MSITTDSKGNKIAIIEGKATEVDNPPGQGNRRMDKVWVAFDLDGTLAYFDREMWGADHLWIGAPIPKMVKRLKKYLSMGLNVKIFTARVGAWFNKDASAEEMVHAIEQMQTIDRWVQANLGVKLEITAVKDFNMIACYDDNCNQVVANTGLTVEEYYGLNQEVTAKAA